MDRLAKLEASDGSTGKNNKLNLSSSSLDSDSTSDTSMSFLGVNPLDESKLREIEELRASLLQHKQTQSFVFNEFIQQIFVH